RRASTGFDSTSLRSTSRERRLRRRTPRRCSCNRSGIALAPCLRARRAEREKKFFERSLSRPSSRCGAEANHLSAWCERANRARPSRGALCENAQLWDEADASAGALRDGLPPDLVRLEAPLRNGGEGFVAEVRVVRGVDDRDLLRAAVDGD